MSRVAILFGMVASFAVIGCGNSSSGPAAHSSLEEKAFQENASLTPQQQIERIEKGPMPPEQKASAIKSIKEKNGLP